MTVICSAGSYSQTKGNCQSSLECIPSFYWHPLAFGHLQNDDGCASILIRLLICGKVRSHDGLKEKLFLCKCAFSRLLPRYSQTFSFIGLEEHMMQIGHNGIFSWAEREHIGHIILSVVDGVDCGATADSWGHALTGRCHLSGDLGTKVLLQMCVAVILTVKSEQDGSSDRSLLDSLFNFSLQQLRSKLIEECTERGALEYTGLGFPPVT